MAFYRSFLLLGAAILGIDATLMEGVDLKAIIEEFVLREKGLSEEGIKRLSPKNSTVGLNDGTSFYGVHWAVPAKAFATSFDDSKWPNATTYTEEVIGVNNKKPYLNFIERFSGAGAEFIWSTKVVLDNEVIVRYTVK